MEILLDVVTWSAAVGAAALALTLLKPVLDRRYSARWRYWVWLVLSALLLLAPVQWEKLLPAAEARPPVIIAVPSMELHVSRDEGVRLQRPAAAPSARPAAAPAQPGRTLPLDTLLPALWLAGAAVYVLRRLAGTLLLLRRAGRWGRAAGEETARLYQETCREMGLKRAPALLVSTAAASPMLAGLLRTQLFLPAEDYSPQELRFILRHELTHYRRRDLWYKLVLLAADALHWFNPLAYLLAREAEADLELTCDDLVMAGADAETRRAYSETLLAAVRRQKGRSALSTHFYGGAQVMKERFRNILGMRGRRWGGIALAIALVLTVTAACTFGLRQETDKPIKDAAIPAPPAPLDDEAAGAWARQVMDADVQALEQEQNLQITSRSIDYLTSQGSWEVDGVTYSAWQLGYRLVSASGETVAREGWGLLFHEPAGERGGQWMEGQSQPWEVDQGYTWEEYTVCYAAYGMRLTDAEGWPARTEEFLADYLNGHNTWATEPQGTALEYLNREYAATGEVSTRYTFAGETSFLMEAACDGQTVRLLLRQSPVEGSDAPIWQIQATQWSGDTLLYTERAELGGGVAGQLDLYGRRPESGGSWGVSRVVWTPSDGGSREFAVADAIALAHPDWLTEKEAVYTDCWNADGGLTLEDVNFDGYLDIGLQASVTAYNLPYYYWTYNPDTGGFDFAFWLLGPMTVDAANQQLVCETHAGPTYYTESYRYAPSGQLYLARRDTTDLSDRSGKTDTETFDKPAGDWRGGSYCELTAQELEGFAGYFNTVELNGLLRFPLRPIQTKDDILALGDFLPVLFYDHNGSAGEMTAEETAAVEEAIGGYLHLDARKLTTGYIVDYLAANYPISREEGEALLHASGDALGTYLPDYGAYYSQRGDTEMQLYRFDSGMRFSDGHVTLYYTANVWEKDSDGLDISFNQSMCAVLSPYEGGWILEQNYLI